MTRVTLEPATLAKLTEQTALFDESGRMVGMFLTPEEALRFVSSEAQRDFDTTTRDECLRDVQQNGAVPAEEVTRILREQRQDWAARRTSLLRE